MKVLLTDGGGILGKTFSSVYQKKYSITILNPVETDAAKFEELDRLFKKHKFDAVIHPCGTFAYSAVEFDSVIAADDLNRFKNVQYASIINGVKKLIVLIDSSGIDLSKPKVNVKEDAAADPRDKRGATIKIINTLALKDKISTVLRFAAVFGERGTDEFNPIMRLFLNDGAINLERDRLLSAVYAGDGIKVISAFLENDFKKGEYNVSPPEGAGLWDIAKKIRHFSLKEGFDVPVKLSDKEKRGAELTLSGEKLKKLLPASFNFTKLLTAVSKTFYGLLNEPKITEAVIKKTEKTQKRREIMSQRRKG